MVFTVDSYMHAFFFFSPESTAGISEILFCATKETEVSHIFVSVRFLANESLANARRLMYILWSFPPFLDRQHYSLMGA